MRLTTALPFVLLALLAGCAPTAPSETPDSDSVTEPTVEPSDSRAPSPTADPVPAVATCENLLEPAHLAQLQASGIGVNPSPEYTQKVTGYDSQFSHFIPYGGVMCPVSNGYSVAWLYGYSPIAPDLQAVEVSRLESSGWLPNEHDGGTLYSDPAVGEGIVFLYYFRDGHWWCADTVEHLTEIVANSPSS